MAESVDAVVTATGLQPMNPATASETESNGVTETNANADVGAASALLALSASAMHPSALPHFGPNLPDDWYPIDEAWDIDPEDATPLQRAILENKIDAIKKIIETGKTLNDKDKNGSTALHYAALARDVNTVEQLLEAEVDIEAKDCYGRTPFLVAAGVEGKGSDAVLYALTLKNCKRDERSKKGWTSLFYAADNDCPETLRILLELGGVDIEARSTPSRGGTTVLFHSNTAALKILLVNGANMATTNNANQTWEAFRNEEGDSIASLRAARTLFKNEESRRYLIIGLHQFSLSHPT